MGLACLLRGQPADITVDTDTNSIIQVAAGKKETRTLGWDLMGKDVNISESFEQPVPAPETNDGRRPKAGLAIDFFHTACDSELE